MKINKRHIEFLKEYEKLCKKYNMGLHGCGCCESPHLIDCNGETWDYVENLDNINFNENGELTIEPFTSSEEKLEDFINRVEKEVE